MATEIIVRACPEHDVEIRLIKGKPGAEKTVEVIEVKRGTETSLILDDDNLIDSIREILEPDMDDHPVPAHLR